MIEITNEAGGKIKDLLQAADRQGKVLKVAIVGSRPGRLRIFFALHQTRGCRP